MVGSLLLITSPAPVAGEGYSTIHESRDTCDEAASPGAGLDAFLTGEVSEWVMNVAREAGIHYLAAGHYATERLGVRALGEHLAARFGHEVEFIDVENPV